MGVDIIPIAQVKENGKWLTNPLPIFSIPWMKGDESLSVHPANNRFPDWFKVLANFDNESGFGYMTNPRGLPDNAELSADQAESFGDQKTKSWVDVADFDNFDWNQVQMKSGVVTINQYYQLRNSAEAPTIYADHCTGVILTMEEADEYLSSAAFEHEAKKLFVRYFWPVNYRTLFKKQLELWEQPLRELTVLFGEARIVFAFTD